MTSLNPLTAWRRETYENGTSEVIIPFRLPFAAAESGTMAVGIYLLRIRAPRQISLPFIRNRFDWGGGMVSLH